jgi:hypothetical protein
MAKRLFSRSASISTARLGFGCAVCLSRCGFALNSQSNRAARHGIWTWRLLAANAGMACQCFDVTLFDPDDSLRMSWFPKARDSKYNEA